MKLTKNINKKENIFDKLIELNFFTPNDIIELSQLSERGINLKGHLNRIFNKNLKNMMNPLTSSSQQPTSTTTTTTSSTSKNEKEETEEDSSNKETEEEEDSSNKEKEKEESKSGLGMLQRSQIKLGNGLYDSEIENILKEFKSMGWSGVICSDELHLLKPKKKMSFIMNTLPRNTKKIGHWISVYIDVKNDKSVEYMDPLGRNPDKKFNEDIKKLVDKIKSKELLKYKINNVRSQRANSKTCGLHSMNFIMNRLNGIPWIQATNFDKINKEEQKLRKKFGYL